MDPLASPSVSDPDGGGGGGANTDHLLDVTRAVDGAEATIRSQLEENKRLKDELMQKTRQLQTIREDARSQGSFGGVHQEPRACVPNKMDGSKSSDSSSSTNPRSTSILHHNGISLESGGQPSTQESVKHKYLDSCQANGAFDRSSGEQTAQSVENGGASRFSTPSSRSLSPTRHRKEGEYDSRVNLAGLGLLPVSEMNANVSWKQDLTVKVKEHEGEIAQLRKHLADYSVKEAQILNGKYMLEKRIAYMRMAFDQQQQDLVDAASKALSYRQDIIEENIRLTYALQAAHQERSTFISSLLPLLSEYDNLQPSALDARSIVSSLKVLFEHLQEQLIITEEKLKESRYQITPWKTELSNNTNLPVQSPTNPLGKALVTSSKSSLDIVPQTSYPHIQSPMSSPVQARGDWGVLGSKNRQVIPSEVPARNADHDDMGRTSLSSSNQFRKDVSAQVPQHTSHPVHFDFEAQSQNPPFKGLSRSDVLDGSEGAEAQHAREPSAQWGPGDSPNLASGLEDANPSYPYLPTVLEEPGSSFSEAAEDDPLPGIDGLRITGEAFPGRELLASGYSTNGTTSCNFEWVRHLEDGSMNFIEGARQPSYLVTADDVDTLLAIEVQPLDDRKRKGEFVKVYANEQRKITCDPEAKELIKKTFEIGHVSYEVQLPQVRFLDMWEPAVLAIKREGYSIKCNGQRGVVLTEKFQQATAINVPYTRPTEFSIMSADGVEYNLKPAENTLPRDTIVLVLRLFRIMALGIWRCRLESETSQRHTPLEIGYQQVKACIEISTSCTEHKPENRPVTGDIIRRLGETVAGGISTSPESNQFRKDVSAQVPQHASHPVHFEAQSQNPPFKDLSRSDVLDASFSEAAEDDPLPGVDGLQIIGEAFPGRELQACGYSTNGTTSCNFEWVRHLDDGSVNFIEGASHYRYLVTADDVDTLLAVEVEPLDDRNRKAGEIVKVYANEKRKITCDPETKELIEKTLEIGHASYEVQLPVGFLDMWEPAVLAIKREGYSIKCNGQRGVVLTEKFQQATAINVVYGRPTAFSIISADGVKNYLKPAENTLPRDTIVLVLRSFRIMAVEKR